LPRYAQLDGTTIINVIIADQDFIDEHKPDAIECPEFVGVGDKYENGEFVKIEVMIPDEPLS
jgi:hypothetical protein